MATFTQTRQAFLLLGERNRTGFYPVDFLNAKANGKRPMKQKAPRRKRGK